MGDKLKWLKYMTQIINIKILIYDLNNSISTEYIQVV